MKNIFTITFSILIISLYAQVATPSIKSYFEIHKKNISRGIMIGPQKQKKVITSNKTVTQTEKNDSICKWNWDTLQNNWGFTPTEKTINLVYDLIGNLISYENLTWNGTTWNNYRKVVKTYNTNNQVTNILTQTWNGSSWQNFKNETTTYNSSQNEIVYLFQNWNGSSWANDYQITNAYDSNNNLITFLQEISNGTILENSYQESFTYDSNNNNISHLSQDWDSALGNWKNVSQELFTYDLNNNQTNYISENWNGSSWENDLKIDLTYDSNNNILSYTSQYWGGTAWENDFNELYTYDINNNNTIYINQIWQSNNWENSQQEIYTYDINNLLLTTTNQLWDGINNWINNHSTIITYNANNYQDSYITQIWNGTGWVNEKRGFTYYNSNNQQVEIINQNWNDTTSLWMNDFQQNYSYDSNFFTKSIAIKRWDDIGQQVYSGDSTYYYDFNITSHIKTLESTNLVVYPNPNNGIFYLKNINSTQKLDIYNLYGELIWQYSEPRLNQIEIDLSSQPKGIYFVKVNSGNRFELKKIITQ